jgi:hypothetical protein
VENKSLCQSNHLYIYGFISDARLSKCSLFLSYGMICKEKIQIRLYMSPCPKVQWRGATAILILFPSKSTFATAPMPPS